MKTIGFIDYYLSEWHANNYPQWIKEENEKLGTDFEVKYAWGEIPSVEDGKTSEEWCKEFGVTKCATIEEVCEKSDYLIILAPSNPEKHLEYAEKVLKYGKRTYVDKTFAPDYQTAKKIFALGEKYNAPFFSSSALRFSTELNELLDAKSILTTGGGRSLEEYCIHQVEMIVKVMNEQPTRLKLERRGEGQYVASIVFANDKTATLVYANALPSSVCVSDSKGCSIYRQISSPFFNNMVNTILGFFTNGVIPFETNQTLSVMKIREGIIKGINNDSQWIEL